MGYDMRMFLRKIFVSILKRKCSTCVFYDGRFGSDECFDCEKSMTAVNYERRRT